MRQFTAMSVAFALDPFAAHVAFLRFLHAECLRALEDPGAQLVPHKVRMSARREGDGRWKIREVVAMPLRVQFT